MGITEFYGTIEFFQIVNNSNVSDILDNQSTVKRQIELTYCVEKIFFRKLSLVNFGTS
jgi:hypothetical protein